MVTCSEWNRLLLPAMMMPEPDGVPTGRPSIMHDLGVHQKAASAMERSDAAIHRRYREAHGAFEFRALQMLVELLRIDRQRWVPDRRPTRDSRR